MKRLLLLLLAIAFAGCVSTGDGYVDPNSGDPFPQQVDCVSLCEEALQRGEDLSSGPCLGLMGNGYVCDIAHDPRTGVDDDPANQCGDWASGKADGFVEVTPDCYRVIEFHSR
jgi:hypothetical protein